MKLSTTLFSALVLVAQSSFASATATDDCHCLPSDSCWPSASTWTALNTTVDGKLLATVPIGSVCHGDTYDATACATLQDDWTLVETQ